VSSASPKTRAPRRSSAEIRRLLLEAAEALFEKQGYQATTTQQIVELARVDAPTLYRHFSSKAELFEVATLEVMKELLAQQFDSWRTGPPGGDLEALVRHFVVGFFEVVDEHRESFRLLMLSSTEDGMLGKLARGMSRQFTEGLATFRRTVLDECGAQDVHGITSPDCTLAASTGMVLCMALFADWLFLPGERPSRDAQVDEIVAMTLHGVAHRPAR
jgi:AcrR family transcriptional regulator